MQVVDLSLPFSQTALAELVGVTQPAISAMVSEGKLQPTGTLGEVLQAYCQRLRLQAAGRMGDEVGGLDLVQERAALAREQREGQAIKNAVARKEFAPVGLLADVLGMAASSVVDRFDQLEGQLRKACPDLPDEAKTTVQAVIASARNEWIRSTERAVFDSIDSMLTDQGDDDPDEGDAPPKNWVPVRATDEGSSHRDAALVQTFSNCLTPLDEGDAP